MKKITIMLLAVVMLLSFSTTKAQTTNPILVSGGISVSNTLLSENFSLGQEFGKNSVSLVLQTTDDALSYRNWYGGVSFKRSFLSVSPTIDLYGDITGLIGLRQSRDLVLKPGVGANLQIAKNFYLQTSLFTPIGERTTLFRPVNLEGASNLVLKL